MTQPTKNTVPKKAATVPSMASESGTPRSVMSFRTGIRTVARRSAMPTGSRTMRSWAATSPVA